MPDHRPPIREELVPGSERLFLFFGGIIGEIGMAPFEFYQASQILDCSRIFFRDLSQSWYLRGLPAIGDDALAIGEFLQTRIMELGPSEIVFVGNSMGGFAALMFCSMLQRGKAIAFAPQTFICPEKRRHHEDQRWSPQIERVHSMRAVSDVYDLKPWIQHRFPEMPADIYVSTSDVLDTLHAEELENFANIAIHRFPDAGHKLVVKLRDDGLLPAIFNARTVTGC